MAVKTQFSDEDLSRIIDQYCVGTFEEAADIPEGSVQTNMVVRTSSGRFVFRYYENRSIDYVNFECELIQFLRRRNFPCPTYLANNSGKFTTLYRGKPIVLSTYESGKKVDQPTWEQERQLVRAVAELNRISQDFSSEYTKHRWNYDPSLCVSLAKGKAEASSSVEGDRKLEWLEAAAQALDLPRALPKCICHSDFHFSNVLYDGDRLQTVIDWDDANRTYTMFDVACLINPFSEGFNWNTWETFGKNDAVFDFAKSRKIVQEYRDSRNLTETETHSLFDVVKLSILLDAVWYFDRNGADGFYEQRKLGYLNRLGRQQFHENIFG